MKYIATLYNRFHQPYFYVDKTSDSICTNTEYSSYETENRNLVIQIIKDFLDVPNAELSLDEVRNQFEDKRCGILSEEKLIAIQNYYNGRLRLYNVLINELNALSPLETKTLHYDIPYEYNHFSTYDEEDHSDEKQLESYIEVKIER